MSVPEYPRGSRLSLAVRLGLPEALDSIRDAAGACGGNAVRMAEWLGVRHRTLCRWMAKSAEIRGIIESARGHDRNVIDKPR